MELGLGPCIQDLFKLLQTGERTTQVHSVFFFFVRTYNFGAEAERAFIFLRFEAENVLKMFLNHMVYTTCISVNQCGRNQETYQSALPADMVSRTADYDKPRCVSPLLMLYKTCPKVFWLIYICYLQLNFIYRLAK